MAAARLRPICDRLNARLASDRQPVGPPDPALLGSLLEVQVSGLCDAASQADGLVRRQAPEPLEAEAMERFQAASTSTQGGFALLQERIGEATSSSERLAGLRQEAEVLSTNLAISVEARSPAQLDRLVADARGLSRNVVDLSDGLAKSLSQLAATGDQIQKAFGRSSDQFQQAIRQLTQWERLRGELLQVGADLTRRVDLLRPGIAGLAKQLHVLTESVTDSAKTQTQLAEALAAAAQGALAVADTSDALLRLLEQFDTGGSTPTSVTRKLAMHQQSLEEAIQELSELAADEGIEALSPESQGILDEIQTMAEAARARILERAEARPTRPRPDTEA
jgi:ABC-type transporter Mla subunit MlaD